jgi:hypothetical protein
MVTVRSEIGPYRRPSQLDLALPKSITDVTPLKSSFLLTDGALAEWVTFSQIWDDKDEK